MGAREQAAPQLPLAAMIDACARRRTTPSVSAGMTVLGAMLEEERTKPCGAS
jgi:hypothetical protein